MTDKLSAAIMHPYFLPYIGYFQLIAAVDTFVMYDNIKYRKKGWINRNRFLRNGADEIFSLPLKKGFDHLTVVERQLSPQFDRDKLLRQFKGAYSKAPFFEETYSLLSKIVTFESDNLFDYIHNSVQEVCQHLEIQSNIMKSSIISVDHGLQGKYKVIAICQSLGADIYINPMGGIELYSKDEFLQGGVELKFLKPRLMSYKQFDNEFVPWLSIVDVLMFKPRSEVKEWTRSQYDLV